MGYEYQPPTESIISTYLFLAEKRTPATRTLTEEDIRFGITHQFNWTSADTFNKMIVDLGNTPLGGEPLWLREGEIFLYTHGRFPARHCAWGKYKGEPCRKPVTKVQLTWGLERWGGPEDYNYLYNQAYMIDSWRHLDGSPLHKNEGDTYGPSCNACEPVGVCIGCGQEYLDNHCSECHQNGALHVSMESYGNRTTCTTHGCDRKPEFFDIGD